MLEEQEYFLDRPPLKNLQIQRANLAAQRCPLLCRISMLDNGARFFIALPIKALERWVVECAGDEPVWDALWYEWEQVRLRLNAYTALAALRKRGEQHATESPVLQDGGRGERVS